VENPDVGEHEDADVQAERRKVADIMASGSPDPPVVIVQNLRKEYTRSLGCKDAGDSDCGKVNVIFKTYSIFSVMVEYTLCSEIF
jgi:hypothetical protein